MGLIRILLIDDDKSIHRLYDKALSGDLFDKRFADNGKEALDLYQAWRPDLLVLDIVMPLRTGYEVLREIRAVRKDLTTKIIVATSLKDNEDVKACIAFGIHGYIIKPFKPKELCNQIDIVKLFQGQ